MKRSSIIIAAAAAIVVAAAAAPWGIGWRTEQWVRARVAQVDADKDAKIRLRVDSYDRGWRGATARISIVDRDGAALLTLPAMIRHWPFASGGPADWEAVPALGAKLRDLLGPWGAKLPELVTRTRLSWGGDLLTQIDSPPFQRRVPEIAGATIDISAIAGTVDWRPDGALAYDLTLPVFHIERQPLGSTGAPDALDFKDVALKGEGSLGTLDRRWNQKGSFSAASLSATEGGATTLTAANAVTSFASRDEGGNVAFRLSFAAAAISAKQAIQNLNDAATEFSFEARNLAKAPLGRLLDAASAASAGPTAAPHAGQAPRAAPPTPPPVEDLLNDLLRGSPAAELRMMLSAREGHIDIKLVLAFRGEGLEPKSGIDRWLERLDAELNARASAALIVNGLKAGASAAPGILPPSAAAGSVTAPPDAPPADPDAAARQQLAQAAAQGLIRLEADEVATTVLWRDGHLTINGQDMTALGDLAKGLTKH
jgi:Bacterial protein of unknown function (DUF945)